jgi:hypothetical protein
MPRTRTYGLDIDTIRYAQRVKSGSGTTILPEPLKQINKFVIGVKKLGLWNSMVCWPMRGIHNAGTGSTVYSLGGLGTYNGTMVNSPQWQQNGVFFLPNSYINAINYVNYPYNTGGFGLSIFAVVHPLGFLPNGANSRNLLLLGRWTLPMLHLTNGVGGGDTMAFQKYGINYNDASLGAGFVNNFARAYGAPSVNTAYYKNNFFFAGYSPGPTIQTCFFAVDATTRLNASSIQPVASYGSVPTSSSQLIVGSPDAITNGLVSISTLINTPIFQTLYQVYPG